MLCTASPNPPGRRFSRASLARERSQQAHATLTECRLCAHNCGCNRLAGERGPCHAGVSARCFTAQVEVSDELELIPTFAIAFSGCDLRCDFCITGKESWNVAAGTELSVPELAVRARHALANGTRSVMILGGEPTIHLPTALALVAALPEAAKLIWKTNAHGSQQARALLAGLFDVWVADFKFGNDACAERLAKVANYGAIVRENLQWAHRHSELIVRHLLMPGHLDCCWQPIAAWLAQELPGVKVNLRTGFWPAWHTARHPELQQPATATAAERAAEIAHAYNLHLIP